MLYIVYQTTNNVNNKIYVGVHKVKKGYDSYIGSGTALNLAIKKYGRHNFSRQTLFEFWERKEAYLKEAEIVTSDFVKRGDTYNIATGGIGGRTHSEETKKKISEGNKGKVLPERQKALISKSRKEYCNSLEGQKALSAQNSGKSNPFYGKTHSKEHRARISRLNRRKRKPCIIDGIIYDSRKSAAKSLEVSEGTISNWFSKGKGSYLGL